MFRTFFVGALVVCVQYNPGGAHVVCVQDNPGDACGLCSGQS